MSVYVDTSALVKWYVPEVYSEELVEYLSEARPAFISILIKVEMRSTMARLRRRGRIDLETQSRILSTFEGDIASGHLVLVPHNVESFLIAESVLGVHPGVPLTTLDALHLGIMRASGVDTLATADKVMACAARALGIDCRTFF